jgi:hypothetical protein
MATVLRAIVVGPGSIGTVHADALRRNGVEVVGPVEGVHIATPNHPHAPLARARRWVAPDRELPA